MPPATRREVRLSASLPDPNFQNGGPNALESSRSAGMLIPNMASILENFEQFQRKHISQNREIIKANAVAQLRIRELENRIQSLEADKVQKQMDTIGLEAQVSQLHHAIGCIHAGWEAIGRGLTLSTGRTQSPRDSAPSQLPPSNRVSIEPNPNAQLVVRSVAKAPDGHIGLLEEEDAEKESSHFQEHHAADFDARSRFGPATGSAQDDWNQHMKDVRTAQVKDQPASLSHTNNSSVSTLDMDGAPSPMGTPELPMELEDAFAAAAFQNNANSWSLPRLAGTPSITSVPFDLQEAADGEFNRNHNTKFLRRSGRKSSRRQSGFVSQQDHSDPPSASQSPNPDSLHSSTPPPSSEPYLPSEADSDMMDGILVYQGDDQDPVLRYTSSESKAEPLTDITNGMSRSSSGRSDRSTSQISKHTAFADVTPRKQRQTMSEASSLTLVAQTAPPSDVRTPGGRKRKIPTQEPVEPMPTPARLFGAAIAATPTVSESVDAEPQTGRTRRVRKSINYALPKLNTKMRKPDPSDLVPASTPHRTPSTIPSSARGMVGSSGNLSDIRKLHEAAAMRQSPAERTSKIRSGGSPGRSSNDRNDNPGVKDEDAVRMADLFEIRQHAKSLADEQADKEFIGDRRHAFWATDSITDTSDDDSRVTSNADLGELAELEAAMSDLCTADNVEQVDTPRAPQPSAWPSRSAAQMSASSSTDSMISRSSGTSSTGAGSQRPSLRRKTTTLPSRSRQSSVEQPLQPEVASISSAGSGSTTSTSERASEQHVQTKVESVPPKQSTKPTVATPSERARPVSASSTSTELGNGRRAMPSSGLAAGMKPKQRPASAGAALTGSRTASRSHVTNSSMDRPRTFSGATAASAGLAQTSSLNGSSNSVSRSSGSSSGVRTSLHSALTNQTKAIPGQMTPRVGVRALPTANTPTFKESPRLAGTPTLRPTVSTSSLASESSGRSSPGLSTASTGSSGTQLSTTTRPALKASTTQQSKMQRPGTAGSASSTGSSSKDSSTPRLNSSSASSTNGARPQPAKSMPSLRRGTEKTGPTSTPRITVRSSSSTLPSGGNASSSATQAASTAASKVAKAITSTGLTRSKEVSAAPMGLGIDFSSMMADVPSGKELMNLTNEIHEVLQSSSSATEASSPLASQAHPSSPTSSSKISSSDSALSSTATAKTRRSSRRVSGLTA